MATESPEFGAQIAGYKIGGVLGYGGFAVVRDATETATGRPVAIKVSRSALTAADAENPFADETRIQTSLVHPNIVPVIGSGVIEEVTIHGPLRYPFLVMPRASISFDGLMRARDGRLPPKTVVRAMQHIAAGLDFAHSSGVLHRDVKPSNVMILGGDDLDGGGLCALTDFGIAATAHRLYTTRMVTTQVPAGTLGYAAPEQFSGKARVPSDVFSMGAMAARALTGVLPYLVRGVEQTQHGNNYLARLKITPREVFSRHVKMNAVLEKMEPVVAQAVSQSMADRQQHAGEFADQLVEAYHKGTSVHVRSVVFDVGRARVGPESVPAVPTRSDHVTTTPKGNHDGLTRKSEAPLDGSSYPLAGQPAPSGGILAKLALIFVLNSGARGPDSDGGLPETRPPYVWVDKKRRH